MSLEEIIQWDQLFDQFPHLNTFFELCYSTGHMPMDYQICLAILNSIIELTNQTSHHAINKLKNAIYYRFIEEKLYSYDTLFRQLISPDSLFSQLEELAQNPYTEHVLLKFNKTLLDVKNLYHQETPEAFSNIYLNLSHPYTDTSFEALITLSEEDRTQFIVSEESYFDALSP